MRAIFISYRREDAEGQAGRLFNDLAKHFGENAVFMDVAGITAGRDFRRAIEEQVASCGVLLAMIGKNWIDAKDESGRRRLEDPADFVRLETASALKRDIPVIPVLVQGARIPRKEQLPEDLAELAYRNGVELTHARWDSDVQVLIKALSRQLKLEKPAGPGLIRFWPKAVAGLVVAMAMAIGGYAWYQASTQRAEEQQLAEEKRKQAEIAERQRLAEEKRKQAEIAERQRLAEEKRKQDELAQRQRLAEERRKQAELAERQRLAEEKRKQEELAERQRLAEERRKQAVQSYPMTCRGGGVSVTSVGTTGVQIRFQPGRGPATSGLAPGQCTWSDRALGRGEPTTICDDRTRSAQYAGLLARSDQYVILHVYNDNRGCMRVTRVGP
jgi:flagellar biosynthesis GTPase FlhF